jgi:hypothetical protein
MKSKAFKIYISLLNQLIQVREEAEGLESKEEDRILDKMDVIWTVLTDKERLILQNIPSRSHSTRS